METKTKRKHRESEQRLAYALYRAMRIKRNSVCLSEKDICRIANISPKTFKRHYKDLDEMIDKNNMMAQESLRAKVRIALRLHFSLEEFFRQLLVYLGDDKGNLYAFRIAVERHDLSWGYQVVDEIKPLVFRYVCDGECEEPLIYILYRITILRIMVQFMEEKGEMAVYARKLRDVTLNFEGAMKGGAEWIEKLLKKVD